MTKLSFVSILPISITRCDYCDFTAINIRTDYFKAMLTASGPISYSEAFEEYENHYIGLLPVWYGARTALTSIQTRSRNLHS